MRLLRIWQCEKDPNPYMLMDPTHYDQTQKMQYVFLCKAEMPKMLKYHFKEKENIKDAILFKNEQYLLNVQEELLFNGLRKVLIIVIIWLENTYL